ncbi:MAG: alkaline phosphatase [Propionibacteriaceae bacterium]|jgi:alkaline phosphatase|nr:alkaline phosphatase [Propionibacteriaceae bacterium]
MKLRTPLIALSALLALPALGVAPAQAKAPAQNVILIIGDGMADAQLSLARQYEYGSNGKMPGLDSLPYTGEYTTFSLDRSTLKPDYDPDSAATGTAWATGYKSYDGAIGVDVYGKSRENLLEAAKAAGKATGVVTTSEVQDATPAVMLGHVTARGCKGPASSSSCGGANMSEQIVSTRADVVIGGGAQYFEDKVGGVSVLDSAKKAGFQVATTAAQIEAVKSADQSAPLLGLLADGNLPTVYKQTKSSVGGSSNAPIKCEADPSGHAPLSTLTSKALELLSANPQGFFLEVEGASIDKQSHSAEPCGQIGETLDLDAAVKVATDFAKKDGNTLVIVTADHGHASRLVSKPVGSVNSLALAGKSGTMYVAYSSAPKAGASQQHDGTQLRIAAYGPLAANVVGLTDQTDVNRTVRLALGLPALKVSKSLAGYGGASRISGDATVAVKKATIKASKAKNVIVIAGLGIGNDEVTMTRNYRNGAAGTLPGIDSLTFQGQVIASAGSDLSSLVADAKKAKLRYALVSPGGTKYSPSKKLAKAKLTAKNANASLYLPRKATVGGFDASAKRCKVNTKAVNLGTKTKAAIKKLNTRNTKGFFLEIGTGYGVKAGNNADVCGQIGTTANLAKAVNEALKFAKKDGRTLVVFTGLSGSTAQIVDENPYSAPSLKLRTGEGSELGVLYTPGGGQDGSSQIVAAYGPGAASLMGLKTKAELVKVIKQAIA